MEKEYIGSQQHFEDSVNEYYDEMERIQREQSREYDKQYLQQPTENQPPKLNNTSPDSAVKELGDKK